MMNYELEQADDSSDQFSSHQKKTRDTEFLKQIILYQHKQIKKLNQQIQEQSLETQQLKHQLQQQNKQKIHLAEYNKSLQAMFQQTTLYTNQIVAELNQSKNELAKKSAALEENVKELGEKQEEINSQKEILEKTLNELDGAYSSITDSIQYAQRIQQAMLPAIEVIRDELPGTMIYFRPRDIVSGDFYWFLTEGDKVFIAAVDCTGHGVPGAFMSLIANDLLHEIVARRNVCEADEILNQLHIGIREVLRQYETNNQDGMDVALCVIEKSTNKVEFSGAHNPLLYIQKEDVYLIKGDRFPIGGDHYTNDRSFTKQTLFIQQPTMLYIYSDGYQDQFGGAYGRKFMAKRFRSLLAEIASLPPKKQERVLDRVLHYWMRFSRQVDDILIIGFKL